MNIVTIKLSPNVTCLVVEDAPFRHGWFRANLPNFDIAETPDEALRLLDSDHQYDMVFLDHDCRVDAQGVRKFVDPTDEDFLQSTYWRVAQYLHRNEYPTTIVIHSGNPVGAERMAALLRSYNKNVYVLPFGTFKVEIER